MIFTILLFWFVGCLLSTPSPDLLCFPYVLENECSSLMGNVSIVEESEQQDFFDEYVSLNVSNVRMAPESCRRPYLSYLCQLMFGSFSCESSSNEEQHCLEEQYCLQVSDLCSDYFQLDCSSSSFSSSPSPSLPPSSPPTPTPTLDCSKEVKEQIEEVKKKPIQVETCLDGLKEEIECCPDPFIFDDNDECVVQCPQYYYGKLIEQWIRIITFILTWICILIFITAMIPLYLTSHLRYPNYVIFVSYGSYLLNMFLTLAATFSGGFVSYVCRGEKNYFTALDHFGHSTSSLLIVSFYTFFNCYCFSHWLLFSFNLFCYSMRPYSQKFEKFIHQPVQPLIAYSMEGFCLCSSLVLFVVVLLDPQDFTPLPIYGTPVVPASRVGKQLYPIIIFAVLGAIFLICTLVLFARRGRHVFYFQWRALVAVFFWIGLLVIFVFFFFLTSSPIFSPNVTDFIDCVGSHPQISPPPCEKEIYRPFFYMYCSILMVVLVIILILVTLWTNDLVIHWWRDFISKKVSFLRRQKCCWKFETLESSEEELLIQIDQNKTNKISN